MMGFAAGLMACGEPAPLLEEAFRLRPEADVGIWIRPRLLKNVV